MFIQMKSKRGKTQHRDVVKFAYLPVFDSRREGYVWWENYIERQVYIKKLDEERDKPWDNTF